MSYQQLPLFEPAEPPAHFCACGAPAEVYSDIGYVQAHSCQACALERESDVLSALLEGEYQGRDGKMHILNGLRYTYAHALERAQWKRMLRGV